MGEKKILVINPNTSEETARRMEAECRKVAAKDSRIDAIHIPEDTNFSSFVVLGYADLAICTVGAIKLAWKHRNDYDGIVLAGFSDVGLDPVRELLDIPVIGIAEAAYHTAAQLGHRFSVLTGTSKWTPPKYDYVKAVGVEAKVASIRPYSEWEEFLSAEELKTNLIRAGRTAIDEDGAEAIIIGGGPLVGFGKILTQALGVPVIDPTLNAVKIMEGWIDLGLCHSKIRRWKIPKDHIGDRYYNRNWMNS